jgi:site-specific DNA-methyltransferase (adenine-specific)
MNAPPRSLLGARERWRVIEDDTLELLPQLPDASVDAVVCDPPYGISFDNQDWDGCAIHHAVTRDQPRLSDGQAFERWTTMWGSELARIVKPGGHLLAFAAPRMSHRLTTGLEDSGLEIRDVLMWLYGQGMPKSRRLPGGLGTALKPAYEPVILARRLPDAALERNLKHHGTGALSIDACRIAPLNLPRERRPHGTHPPCDTVDEGRWPANVILTHAARCRPARCAAACPAGCLDRQAPGAHEGRAGASRFFYCAKASRRERDAGCHELPARNLDLFPNARRRGSRRRTVRNAHPTVKPIEVMRWLVRLACPPEGLVLDPFCGSGSTGIAAVLEGRHFLGIELDPNHVQLARTRITHSATSPSSDS